MYNKSKKYHEPYPAQAQEPSKYVQSPTHCQTSHSSTTDDSYKLTNLYIKKPFLLCVCYIDEDLQIAQKENLVSCTI